MNVENLTKLRDHIAALPDDRFEMDDPRMCIAGHARTLSGNHTGWFGDDVLEEWLEISQDEAGGLYFGAFLPEGTKGGRAEAVAELTRMLEEQA